MNKETTVFTVRTSPEIKNGIENIMTEIMEEQGINNKGEAFGLLTDAFKEYKAKEMTPEFKLELKTVKDQLNNVYSSILSITDRCGVSLQEKDRDFQKKSEDYEERIKELEIKNGALEYKAQRLENQVDELKEELKKAQKELEDKRQLDDILNSINELKSRN